MAEVSWHLYPIRRYIHSLGQDQEGLLDTLESVGRYTDIFQYHMATARDAMSGILDRSENAQFENMKLVFGASERQGEFVRAGIVSEANMLGCFQSSRSLWDVFAQLVNGLLVTPALSVHACDIHKVAQALRPCPTKGAINDLLRSDWFVYIADFVNTAKHRRLVKHGLNVSLEDGGGGTAIVISAFAYEHHGVGRKHPSYTDVEALKGAIEVKNRIVECGNVLANQLIPG